MSNFFAIIGGILTLYLVWTLISPQTAFFFIKDKIKRKRWPWSLLIFVAASLCNLGVSPEDQKAKSPKDQAAAEQTSDNAEPETAPTTSLGYTVLKVENEVKPNGTDRPGIKRMYTVEIDSTYTKEQLTEIADVICNQDTISEDIYISYFLKGQPKTGVNYGYVNRLAGQNTTSVSSLTIK